MNNRLLIITDLGMVKAYRLNSSAHGTPRLSLLEEIFLEEAHQRVTDNVTDLAGRRVSPTHAKWGNSMADNHNLKEETKRRLMKQIAGHVKRLVDAHSPDACWLAAHKSIHHFILDALPKPTRDQIGVDIALDLIKADEASILDAFSPYLPVPKGGTNRRVELG